MRTRLAPTPSGYLHAGNIYNFLLNWLWARSNNGQVLLRIDDGDAARKRPEYVEDIFRVLDWLGLDWDLGPAGPDDFERHWSQVHRHHLYRAVLDELIEKKLVFACTCTRKQQQPGPHKCQCAEQQIPLRQPGAAWRIKMTENPPISFHDNILGAITINVAAATGAFVLKRKDGIPAYQVCSLADDRHFGITHICRGQDLLPSTAMQLYINRQFCRPFLNGCTFWHHPLITAANGEKLSKSAGAMGSSMMHHINKAALLNNFCTWMGWPAAGTGNAAGLLPLFNALQQ